jgi:hypothetical protein
MYDIPDFSYFNNILNNIKLNKIIYYINIYYFIFIYHSSYLVYKNNSVVLKPKEQGRVLLNALPSFCQRLFNNLKKNKYFKFYGKSYE